MLVTPPISYIYHFHFEDGVKKTFTIAIDSQTLNLIRTETKTPPDWAKLDYQQCPNCPLKKEESPYCPVALNLAEITSFFKGMISYKKVDMVIESKNRTYVKNDVPIQRALSSLMGIIMTTSGCPILGLLKPMVRHHLPFADPDETHFRAISMYLMAQFFRQKNGLETDWDLKDLATIYSEIRTVNRSFCERIKSVAIEDALANAVVVLDTFANGLLFSLDKKSLPRIELLFKDYL